jgi:hypothetical protein
VSANSTFTTLNYAYQLQNTATSPKAAKIFSLVLLPCEDPGATVSSSQWISEAGILELISARRCEFSALERSLLAPGSKLTDAKVTSRWLPGIGRAIVSSEAAAPVWPSGEATPRATYDLAETVNSDYLGGKKVEMVVPLRDPALFATSDGGLGLVLADLEQACKLGWIGRERDEESRKGEARQEQDGERNELCDELKEKLQHAQKALARGKKANAAHALQEFLHELSEKKDKRVNSNAYALLFTNVDYLVTKVLGVVPEKDD